jgi:hypothetical protein
MLWHKPPLKEHKILRYNLPVLVEAVRQVLGGDVEVYVVIYNRVGDGLWPVY